MSCDVEIPKALLQQILQVDEDQYAFLFTALCRDEAGELLQLDEDQLQLLYAVGERSHGVVIGCALDAIRRGIAGCIEGDWARLIDLHQAVSNEKCSLMLQAADSVEAREKMDELNQTLLQVSEYFHGQTGYYLQ